MLVDDIAAATFWRLDTSAGPVIVRGPELVRSATLRGPSLELTGDTTAAATLEVWGPRPVGLVTWNGSAGAHFADVRGKRGVALAARRRRPR